MFTIILAVAIATQYEEFPRIADEFVNGMAFAYQVEEFVHEACEPRDRRAIQEGFRLMGDSRWKVRDQASKDWLAKVSKTPGEARWLFWGRHNADLEISLRCNNIIKKLYICNICKGQGMFGDQYKWACDHCNGNKSLWGLTPWD